MMKVEMDKMFADFKRAELGTTMADCDMPYDETTVLNENNVTQYLQKLEE